MYYALGYGSYVSEVVPLLCCRFHGAVVDEASRVTCCRGSSVSITFVHVVAATLQPAVAAQAINSGRLVFSCFFFSRSLADAMRLWRKGSSRPEKRSDSHQDWSNIAYVMQSRCQASAEHAASLAVLSSDTVDGPYSICGFRRVCGPFFGPFGRTSSLLSVSTDGLTVMSRLYGRQCGLFAQWLHVALHHSRSVRHRRCVRGYGRCVAMAFPRPPKNP